MSTEALERIFVLLAYASLAFVVVVAVGALLQAVGVGRLGSRVAGLLDGTEVALGWVVALTAMAGSLYFSEVADYVPCELCWFQRIAMYPLAVVLLIALVRGERWIAPYALVLSLLGLAVAIYHYQLEWFPEQATFCSAEGTVPCTVVWFKVYGYGTLPMLAGSAFLLIATLTAIAWRNERVAAAYEGGDDGGESATAPAGDAPVGRVDEESAGAGRMLAVALAAGLGLVAVAAAVGGVGYLATRDDDDAGGGAAVYADAGCGACHAFAPARSAGTVGPALDGTTLSEAEIRVVVKQGRGTMVGYGSRLSDQELADLAAYVKRG